MDVVLSEIDPRGELKSNAGFCFPAQIAHGAVLDLVQRGVDLIFLPHVMRMPRRAAWNESYLCPITQASPYFLAKAYPQIQLLSPLLDFSDGYAASSTLVDMAVNELGRPRDLAERQWTAAVAAQTEAERDLLQLGHEALEQAIADGKPAVILAGHSYNAFTPEGSQSVGKKLSSMGVVAIPADCLIPAGAGPTSWHFANQVMNAVNVVKQHANLFLLCVSNFSCTIDAFTQSMLASEMGSKPYLILEIDAHTADAGVQTRLEAFLDIVKNFRGGQSSRAGRFNPTRLIAGGQVTSMSGSAHRPAAQPAQFHITLNLSHVSR
jgi:predicted nucleotide-binding protein (sugar kinase/HSP70/actin superfamily)